MFLPVQLPLNFWARQGDPLENMQEEKKQNAQFQKMSF